MSWKMWLAVVALVTPAAAQIGRRPVRPQVTRPDDAVWQVIRANCTSCHGIDDYAFYALDKAGWQSLIETKHKTEPIALRAEDRNTLLDWLAGKFGPDSKPFPRSYIPPEITTFFSDPEANRLLDRVLHYLPRARPREPVEERRRAVARDRSGHARARR